MALIVVGGHSRGVGKTSVAAGIIAALPKLHWTALKITPHLHGMNSAVAAANRRWAISKERQRRGDTDTSRFLAAGAERAFLVRSEPEALAEAMPAVQQLLAEAKNAIIESNAVLQFVKPDLYLLVIDPATADFKASAKEFLHRAGALIVHTHPDRIVLEPMMASSHPRSVFFIDPPRYMTAEIIDFVSKVL